jgi:midasin (ATPase involved in ribosome maturation)
VDLLTHTADNLPHCCHFCCCRWAERGAVGYEALALDGFMVLGERLRSAEERGVVVEVLQTVLRVQLDLEQVGGRVVCCVSKMSQQTESA